MDSFGGLCAYLKQISRDVMRRLSQRTPPFYPSYLSLTIPSQAHSHSLSCLLNSMPYIFPTSSTICRTWKGCKLTLALFPLTLTSVPFLHPTLPRTEILRHGKHANQSTSSQQQNTSPSSSSKKQRDQPHQQPQQAAYYNNDMPTQGLTANNGEYFLERQRTLLML